LTAALAAGAFAAVFLTHRNRLPPSDDGTDVNAPPGTQVSAGYIDTSACVGCHREIWETYSLSGMARSFSVPSPSTTGASFEHGNTFYHEASERHYTMIRRGEAYFMRRHQIGWDGAETNVVEKRIDFVMGSGNKAQTFLSRTPSGELVELPVAWYTERGGFWAMNPGYDRPDHEDFRRRIRYDCMFCHNAYPPLEKGIGAPDAESAVYPERLPSGIDCQRCHGPGLLHIEAAAISENSAAIRSSIVNPARLSAERQLEVCMQCHLQSASSNLPYAVLRRDRGVFSYRPGEPLAEYALHFDHAPGTGHDDKFEIAHAAYGLRRSVCFQESGGRLTCTICHDPHAKLRHGPNAQSEYATVCMNCHETSLGKIVAQKRHTAERNCVECHMPQRRTDDVVHVVMTDHNIQRHTPARDLLAPRSEPTTEQKASYRAEVALYYPPALERSPENELDLALAQVIAGANLTNGLPRLKQAIEKHHPPGAEYYFELAEAYRKAGDLDQAFDTYEKALEKDRGNLPTLRNYGMELARSGHAGRGAELLRRALALAPSDPRTHYNLGAGLLLGGSPARALTHLTKSLEADPGAPDVHNAIAQSHLELGDPAAAERGLREAIRLQPDFGIARSNLASLLVARGETGEAQFHFQKAIAAAPKNADHRLRFGKFLLERQQIQDAKTQLAAADRLAPNAPPILTALGLAESLGGNRRKGIEFLSRAIELDPRFAEAHYYMGTVLAEGGDRHAAKTHLSEAARLAPGFHQAQFQFGMLLASEGNFAEALLQLEKASTSQDPKLRGAALAAVRKIRTAAPAATGP
jgi:Tfp pilus assembly protein PilF